MNTRELPNGVVIYQITDERRLVSNIYCERPYCSRDSKRFLYARQVSDSGPNGRRRWHYVLCEFGTWHEEVVGEGYLTATVSYGNDFYFQRRGPDGGLEFVRLDMDTGAVEHVWTCRRKKEYAGHPTVSSDGRLLAYHYPVSYAPQRFGVAVVDITTGEKNTVFEHPHLCNAHLQFHPTDNRTLLVQLNRGCEFTPEGKRLKLVGDEGATLLLLDAVSGKAEQLAIGRPHTPRITGHEAWLGSSSEVIATVSAEGEYIAAPGKGTTVLVGKGKPCRQLGTGVALCHIGTTHCGRYFYGDRIKGDYVAIGSPLTGRTVAVHEDPEDPGGSPFGQQSHPHAYLSPDFRWMVFNSDRTGQPQVYVAGIPSGLVASLGQSGDAIANS